MKAALRQVARKPLGNAAAAATLALGIGSSVALLSLVDAVLLRPLPCPNALRLRHVPVEAPPVTDGALDRGHNMVIQVAAR